MLVSRHHWVPNLHCRDMVGMGVEPELSVVVMVEVVVVVRWKSCAKKRWLQVGEDAACLGLEEVLVANVLLVVVALVTAGEEKSVCKRVIVKVLACIACGVCQWLAVDCDCDAGLLWHC